MRLKRGLTMLAPNNKPEPLLVSSRDAAAMLSISERKLWTLTNRGDLPRIKVDRTVRYAVDDLRNFIDRQRAGQK
jgi:hypothetical protein